MSEVQKQIERNRKDAAVQKMNNTLAAEDQPGCTTKPGSELPIFGEPYKNHVQTLNPKDGTDKR